MSQEKRIIKKYPNRRLYDMATSGYITVADVKQMIIELNDVVVQDAKTGNDITRQVLLQILLEEEAGGQPLLNDEMLCQFIRVYGQASQSVLGPFLAQNMKLFGQWQASMQGQGQGQPQSTTGAAQESANQWFSALMMPSKALIDWQHEMQLQTLKFWEAVKPADQNTEPR
ncbi:MAG: polyhydroxyalkanoate synthesis repressor PhaR [Neisseriaceae bacterium]|nr:polyhydroxyalkanoate synthesis repressor PhaR [Neisseriaceae bacterium]